MIREEVPIGSIGISPPIDKGDTKTLCRDVETCETLNHFLDTGYGVPPTLAFNIQSTQEGVGVTIDFAGFGVRERAELTGRLVNFVMNELNKIKNVQ